MYGKSELGRIDSRAASKFNGKFCTGGILCTRNFTCGSTKFRPKFRCTAKFYGESAQSSEIELSSEIKQTDNHNAKRCTHTIPELVGTRPCFPRSPRLSGASFRYCPSVRGGVQRTHLRKGSCGVFLFRCAENQSSTYAAKYICGVCERT